MLKMESDVWDVTVDTDAGTKTCFFFCVKHPVVLRWKKCSISIRYIYDKIPRQMTDGSESGVSVE